MANAPASRPAAAPTHGVGSLSVDWDRLYAYLESLLVQVPEPDAGAPPDLDGISTLMARVQNNRSRLEMLSTLIDRRCGESRRAWSIAVERLRLEKAEARRDHRLRLVPSRDRELAVQDMTGPSAAAVAELRSRLDDFDSARSAVRGQVETMQTAKETLNALRQMAAAGPGGTSDDFIHPASGRRYRS